MIGLTDLYLKFKLLLILRTINRCNIRKILSNIFPQILCVLTATMHQHHMRRLHPLYKLSRLRTIRMSRKTYFLNRQIHSYWLIIIHTVYTITFLQITGDTTLSAVASYAHPIFGIMTPPLQQSSRLSILQHSRCAHDHHRVIFLTIYSSIFLKIVNMFVFEGIGLYNINCTSYL